MMSDFTEVKKLNFVTDGEGTQLFDNNTNSKYGDDTEHEIGTNIKVICRIRPQLERDSREGERGILSVVDDKLVVVKGKEQNASFRFDRVFDSVSTQDDVYNYAIRLKMEDFFHGYNGAVMAYGQTGSGKSFTMMGSSISDNAQKGLIPRMADDMFSRIHRSTSDTEYTVGVSYMEVYMEQIRDLLDPASNNGRRFSVHEDKVNGVHVRGLSQAFISSSEEFLTLLKQGSKARAYTYTDMNFESSRSHAILQLNLTQRQVALGTVKKSRMFLVDLAGSEKVIRTGAMGQTLEEAKKINSSLSTLGNVINSLTDGRSTHIPYRDSKLTRILQESLGGNSQTSLIINCSPCSKDELETLSTLRFGSRAKHIKNKVHINTELNSIELVQKVAALEKTNMQNQLYIKRLEQEVQSLTGGKQISPSVMTDSTLVADEHSTKAWHSERTGLSKNLYTSAVQEEIERRDKKIGELENMILLMKMEQLKLSHQDELKLFRLESSLHDLNNKLTDLEIVNANLRRHLLLCEKIIESRDDKISKLQTLFEVQQNQVEKENSDFESKVAMLRQHLASSVSKQKAQSTDDAGTFALGNISNSTDSNSTDRKSHDDESTAFKNSQDFIPSPKVGINLNIVKPLRGGVSSEST